MVESKAAVRERLESDDSWKTKTKTKLSIDDISNLLDVCTDNTYFTFEGKIYKQTDGSPMGSSISGTIADIFLQKLEKSIITGNTKIHLWTRYMDDVLAVIDSDASDEILQLLNSFHPNIQFTIEEEEQGKLPFLDVMIMRNEDSIKTKVYRKSTHTDRYLNFNSFHHVANKMSVVDTLVFRAFTVCHKDHLEEEFDYIRKVLVKNDYPIKFINSRISRMKRKIENPTSTSSIQQPRAHFRLDEAPICLNKNPFNFPLQKLQTAAPPPIQNLSQLISEQEQANEEKVEEKERWVPIPFMGLLSNKITGLLRRKMKWKITFTPGTKLKRFLESVKDPEEASPPGIYEIPCEPPCKETYIGQSVD